MRNFVLGAVGGLVLFVGLWWFANSGATAYAQRNVAAYGEQGELTTVFSDVDERVGLLTLVDPRSRVVCVYHIDRATGEISLKSVRNVNWDLQMMQFNSKSPLPQEIRGMLDQP
ncbi:MAG: hypothetical protein KDA42_09660 [Planctomycetales bacterium]|nr:hypothetical protein [Planctomycetales bacterium]